MKASYLHGVSIMLNCATYLPHSNRSNLLDSGPPEDPTQLESIGLELEDIVEDSPEGSHWVHRGKEEDVTKLHKHLQVVIIRVLQQASNITTCLVVSTNFIFLAFTSVQ